MGAERKSKDDVRGVFELARQMKHVLWTLHRLILFPPYQGICECGAMSEYLDTIPAVWEWFRQHRREA